MSEEKRYDSFELDDDELENVAGGKVGRRHYRPNNDAKFTCNKCGGNAFFVKPLRDLEGYFTHTCGETYYIHFMNEIVVDSNKKGVKDLVMTGRTD